MWGPWYLTLQFLEWNRFFGHRLDTGGFGSGQGSCLGLDRAGTTAEFADLLLEYSHQGGRGELRVLLEDLDVPTSIEESGRDLLEAHVGAVRVGPGVGVRVVEGVVEPQPAGWNVPLAVGLFGAGLDDHLFPGDAHGDEFPADGSEGLEACGRIVAAVFTYGEFEVLGRGRDEDAPAGLGLYAPLEVLVLAAALIFDDGLARLFAETVEVRGGAQDEKQEAGFGEVGHDVPL